MALLLSVTVSNQAAVGQSQIVASSPIVQAASVAVLTKDSPAPQVLPDDVETYVRAYFAKTPVLAEVARCESQFRQWDKSGSVLHGKAVPDDVGVMQINEYFHKDTANKMGYNLNTLEGNLAYAKNLYERKGLKPWSASQACWDK